jgi:hypothetical protein
MLPQSTRDRKHAFPAELPKSEQREQDCDNHQGWAGGRHKDDVGDEHGAQEDRTERKPRPPGSPPVERLCRRPECAGAKMPLCAI